MNEIEKSSVLFVYFSGLKRPVKLEKSHEIAPLDSPGQLVVTKRKKIPLFSLLRNHGILTIPLTLYELRELAVWYQECGLFSRLSALRKAHLCGMWGRTNNQMRDERGYQ